MRTLFVTLLLAISSPVLAQEPNLLIGNWKLVSFQTIVDNEAPQNLYGSQPNGYLILTREGRMMRIVTADNRKGEMSDAERAALHKTLIAYSGRYRIEGSDFITTVDASWNESWNGTEQKRQPDLMATSCLSRRHRSQAPCSQARVPLAGLCGSEKNKHLSCSTRSVAVVAGQAHRPLRVLLLQCMSRVARCGRLRRCSGQSAY
jgi:lipocalin-like protein